jgi:hypothetical protein
MYFKHDSLGNKDKITLKTESGKLITRTCQHWRIFSGSTHKAYITYKGESFYVEENAIYKINSQGE